jgi:large subunit ribosomal protein L18
VRRSAGRRARPGVSNAEDRIPKTRQDLRRRRHLRVRKALVGTTERPRLVVFRSLKHITAQVVDDTRGHTLLTVTDNGLEGKKSEKSLQVGKLVAERAKQAGITRVVFDRAGYQYHGRVKAVADGAREGGLEF